MSEAAKRYHVLVEEDPFVDPRVIADDVAQIYGISSLEARRRIRAGMGIVAEDVSEEEATTLLGKLADAGVAARLAPAQELPSLPHIEVFSGVTATPEGMELISSDGAAQALALWEQIGLVNVAILSESGYVDRGQNFEAGLVPGVHRLERGEAEVVRENLILKRQARDPRESGSGEPILAQFEAGKLKRHSGAVDVVGRMGACWFRVPSRHIVYRHGRIRLGGELGFARFVRTLAEKCDKRVLSPLTLKVISGDDIRSVALAGQAELTRHTRWQLYLQVTETTG